MNDIVQNNDNFALMEKVIIDGDLTKLTPQERIMFYNKTCESLKLNPLTKPFSYIKLNGKLTLYANKDATEQLRKINKISIVSLESKTVEGVYVITATARGMDGHTDIATGAVNIQGLRGEALANAFLKAETKAKRRVTLSICGLGFTDESEVDSIPNAKPVDFNQDTGEIVPIKVTTEHIVNDKSPFLADKHLKIISEAKTREELQAIFYKAAKELGGDQDALDAVIYAKDMKKAELEALKNMA